MRERERGREERARSLQIIKIIKEACPQKGKKCNFIFRSDGNEMNKMIEDKKITNQNQEKLKNEVIGEKESLKRKMTEVVKE